MSRINEKEIAFRSLIDSTRDTLAELTLGIMDIPLDYTLESLELAERRINEMYKPGHQPMFTTLIPFGYLLGETIVRNTPGAEWDFEDVEYIEDIKVKVKGHDGATGLVKPFIRVSKFWNDRTDGLAALCRMVMMISNGSLANQIKMAENEEWIKLPNGDMFRVKNIDKDSKE